MDLANQIRILESMSEQEKKQMYENMVLYELVGPDLYVHNSKDIKAVDLIPTELLRQISEEVQQCISGLKV